MKANTQDRRVARRMLGVGLAVFFCSLLSVRAGLFNGWSYGTTFTVSGYTRGETLTNFPVLVTFDSTDGSGFSYLTFALSGGTDLRFTDASGETELPYEIDTWNTNGVSSVWVRVPELTAATQIKALWGNAFAPRPDYTTNGAVWADGYRAVWHFSDGGLGALAVNDSSPNGKNGTPVSGQSVAQTSVVGRAGDFVRASQQYASIGLSSYFLPSNNTPFSLSMWLRPVSAGSLTTDYTLRAFTLVKAGVKNSSSLIVGFDTGRGGTTGGRFFLFRGNVSGTSAAVRSATQIGLSAWYHVAATFDGSSWGFYVNGQKEAAFADSLMGGYSGSDALAKVGCSPDPGTNGHHFDGQMDEIRFSSVSRSSNWVWAAYANAASPATFAERGAILVQGSDGSPAVLDSGVAALSNTFAAVSGCVVTGDAPVAVYAYYGTGDGGTDAGAYEHAAVLADVAVGVPFAVGLEGLLPNTTYYYALLASNAVGSVWAPRPVAATFKTLGPPVVGGLSVESVAYNTAVLRGTLSDGTSARLVFYAGESDGAWSVTNDLGGVAEGVYTGPLAGLTRGTSYVCRLYATNAYGEAWSSAVSFDTLAVTGGGFYVTPLGAGAKNGADWENAFDSVQAAISASVEAGDVIYLAAGDYAAASALAVSNAPGLTIRGGYAGAGSPGASDGGWSRLKAVSGASHRILEVSGSVLALDGVAISGGRNAGRSTGGAGLFVIGGSSVALLNGLVEDNSVTGQDETGFIAGAGVFVRDSVVGITNSVIQRNLLTGGGNGTSSYGAGIYIERAASETSCDVVGSRIAGNIINVGWCGSSVACGAGVYVKTSGSSFTARNVLFTGNDAYETTPADSDLPRYLAACKGDALHVDGGSASLAFCTVVGNLGEGVRRAGGTLSVSHSVLWDNGDDVAGTVSLLGCDVEDGDGAGSNGNVSADPRFERGWYLSAASPCADAGTDTAEALGVAGLTLFADGTPDTGAADIGCHFEVGLDPALADLCVSPSGDDASGDGSVGAPFKTATKALSVARPGTRVHLAAGVYSEAGGETLPLVIKDIDGVQLLGEGAGATLLDGGGSKRVLTVECAGGDTRIDGLTVRNGYGYAGSAATIDGAGIYVWRSTLALASAAVVSNRLEGYTSTGTIYERGAGLFAFRSKSVVTNTVFEGNAVGRASGGRNEGPNGGGAFMDDGRSVFYDCRVTGNRARRTLGQSGAQTVAGGVYFKIGSHALVNCVVAGNTSTDLAGGVYLKVPSVVNACTIADNTPEGVRVVVSASLTNCIVWGNGGGTNNAVAVTGASLAFVWSDVQNAGDGATQENCFSADPLFADAAAGDYHLQSRSGVWNDAVQAFVRGTAYSPCLDAGDPADLRWVNEPQPNGKRINLGAYGGTFRASMSRVTGTALYLF